MSTVRRIRSVLAQALDQGVRWGSVTRNVASLTRPPKATRKEGRTLTPEQARHLLDTLKGHRSETLYALMLSTGLRRGEALGLKWDDFNPKEGTVSIRRQLTRENGSLATKDTKTARSRRSINLPTRVVEDLKAHKVRQARERLELGPAWQDTGYIFTSSVGTPLDPRNLNREFKIVCQKASLGDWHPHELRHSAASLMLAQGVKIQVVSEVLGHSSIRMTADVYGHILAPDREAAAAAMSATLWPN
ncbi:MAG: site-specific integrase [Actinomycetota bacterium]|nr:MAG: site-specific integrase [Actinomycetota bacterium]